MSQSMDHFLCLWCFKNQREVEASVKKFFALKDKNWYHCGVKELAERRLQTVQHDGVYFECEAAFAITWRIYLVVKVESSVKVTQSWTILDLIFSMQASLGNKKNVGKWSDNCPFVKAFWFPNDTYIEKNNV